MAGLRPTFSALLAQSGVELRIKSTLPGWHPIPSTKYLCRNVPSLWTEVLKHTVSDSRHVLM